MKIIIISLLLAFTAFQVAAQDQDSAQYVVPSTVPANIKVYTAPEGFVVGQGFNGYYHPMTQVSVVLTMIQNANYINMKRSMTPEFFAENKLVLTKEFNVVCDSGLNGYGYVLTFEIDGKAMTRQMVFIGNMNTTLWLSVTYPQETAEMVESVMIESYKSVDFNK